MNAMVDANSNYPSADEIAQALNDGERMRQENERLRNKEKWRKELNMLPDDVFMELWELLKQRKAADALREGAGDETKL